MSNTKKLKQKWCEFQKTRTWKIIFLTLDTLFRGITYILFFAFVAIFSDHVASSKLGFYGPMFLLLALVLVFVTIGAISTMSWIGVVILDVVVAGFLILTVWYPCWSEDYRGKMGYRQWFA